MSPPKKSRKGRRDPPLIRKPTAGDTRQHYFRIFIVSFVCALCGTVPIVWSATFSSRVRLASGYYFETPADMWTLPKDDELDTRGNAFSRVGYDAASDGAPRMRVDVALASDRSSGTSRTEIGQVLVYTKLNPPYGHEPGTLLNLDGETVTASVEVDVVGKRVNDPLFLQLFFEGCDPVSGERLPPLYDPAWAADLYFPGQQLHISAEPSGEVARTICVIGLKIGMKDADPNSYEGAIYVKSVTW